MRFARLAALAALSLIQLDVALAAEAQPVSRTPRIGLLSVGTDPSRPLPPQWLASSTDCLHAC